jgi:hypothetical protein
MSGNGMTLTNFQKEKEERVQEDFRIGAIESIELTPEQKFTEFMKREGLTLAVKAISPVDKVPISLANFTSWEVQVIVLPVEGK